MKLTVSAAKPNTNNKLDMFNIAFPEFIVIVVVSLIFIGPDKLPKVAQTLGVMMGRIQRFMSSVKNDIDQELKNNDLHRLQEEQPTGIGAGSEQQKTTDKPEGITT